MQFEAVKQNNLPELFPLSEYLKEDSESKLLAKTLIQVGSMVGDLKSDYNDAKYKLEDLRERYIKLDLEYKQLSERYIKQAKQLAEADALVKKADGEISDYRDKAKIEYERRKTLVDEVNEKHIQIVALKKENKSLKLKMRKR